MNTIQYDSGTRLVHKKFIDWSNGLLAAYTSGFWDNAIKNVLAAAFIQKVTVFMQEMYSLDGRTALGYLMITDADGIYRALYFDYATGLPTHYCNSGLEAMMELDAGVVKQFFTNTEVSFSGASNAKLLLTYEYLFGIKYAVVTFLTTSGNFISKGALDMVYDLRTSGTYSVDVIPIDVVPSMELKNIAKAPLKFELPLLDGFSVEYRVNPGQSIVVPRTPLSEHFVSTSFDQSSLVYRFL